jgi:hypothetical protein
VRGIAGMVQADERMIGAEVFGSCRRDRER